MSAGCETNCFPCILATRQFVASHLPVVSELPRVLDTPKLKLRAPKHESFDHLEDDSVKLEPELPEVVEEGNLELRDLGFKSVCLLCNIQMVGKFVVTLGRDV